MSAREAREEMDTEYSNPIRFQHPANLGNGFGDIHNMLERIIGYHHVKTCIAKGHILRIHPTDIELSPP
jgi:hypothetical protein